jgi:hypothetical protein
MLPAHQWRAIPRKPIVFQAVFKNNLETKVQFADRSTLIYGIETCI